MAVEASVSCSRLSRTSVVARAGAAHQVPSRTARKTCVGVRFFIPAVVGGAFTALPFSLFRREQLKGAPLRSRRGNVQTPYENRKLARRVLHLNIARAERRRRAVAYVADEVERAAAAVTGGGRGPSHREAVRASRYRMRGSCDYS